MRVRGKWERDGTESRNGSNQWKMPDEGYNNNLVTMLDYLAKTIKTL